MADLMKKDPDNALARVEAELVEQLTGTRRRRYGRFMLAALSSVPWVGGFLSACAARDAEEEQEGINHLHRLWIEEHREKLAELARTLGQIVTRLDGFGGDVQERIESPNYLALVGRTFRSWDQAETSEKRDLLRKLITNAGASTLCSDDLVRLFIKWIDDYHETHFRVIAQIYREPGITRGPIWESIHGRRVREDSAEADLFKRLIRDLSTGGVVRQQRETNEYGEFLKKPRSGRAPGSSVAKSAFDETEPYVLTSLGAQFVHYTMEELVPRIEAS